MTTSRMIRLSFPIDGEDGGAGAVRPKASLGQKELLVAIQKSRLFQLPMQVRLGWPA